MFGRKASPPDEPQVDSVTEPPLLPAQPPDVPIETVAGAPAIAVDRQAGQSAVQPPSPETLRVLEDKCAMAVRMQAAKAYMAYCENSGNKNFRGEECPKWEDLPKEIRSHWCAAVVALLPHLNNQ